MHVGAALIFACGEDVTSAPPGYGSGWTSRPRLAFQALRSTRVWIKVVPFALEMPTLEVGPVSLLNQKSTAKNANAAQIVSELERESVSLAERGVARVS